MVKARKQQMIPASTQNDFRKEDKLEGEMGITVGGSYRMDSFVFYGEYDKDGYKATVNTAKGSFSESTLSVGAAQMMEMGEGSHWFWDARLSMPSEETKVAADQAKLESSSTVLRLTAGFESDVTSWLALRGSVSQDAWSSKEEKKGGKTFEDSLGSPTSVAAGASLRYGKFSIDGVIGQENDGSSKGRWNFDTFSKVAATYRF